MPATTAALLLALITGAPLSRAEQREVALVILQLVRRLREAQAHTTGRPG